MSLSLNQFLLLYTWFLTTALLVFLLLIARFYQNFSGRRTHYRFFLAPIGFWGIFAVRYANLDRLAGNAIADLALGMGGIVLLILCGHLYRLMLIRKKPPTGSLPPSSSKKTEPGAE